MKMLITVLLGLSLAATLANSMSSDDPADWLEMMTKARKIQNYQGTIIYSRGNEMSSMHLLHRFNEGLEEERLIALDGEPREIIRSGDNVICIFPGNEQVQLEQALPTDPFPAGIDNTAPLKSVYSIKVAGMERLAGYEVVKVAVMAKDQFRYSYLMWLEKESGLLVKSMMTGKDGEVLEHFQFTSLDIGSPITDDQIKGKSSGLQISHETPATKHSELVPLPHKWQLKWLPVGFSHAKFISKRNSVMPEDSRTRVYSDGLAMFSVFVEPQADAGMPEGASRMGGTTAYSRYVQHNGMKYVITVVGEIPIETAVKVANNMLILSDPEEAS